MAKRAQAARKPERSAGTIVVDGPAVLRTPRSITLTDRQIGRLSQYRRQLQAQPTGSPPTIYSHRLAALCGLTAAQVRRDLMTIGFTGSPARGYDIPQLVDAIGQCLDAPGGQNAALVGAGNLGRAILDYFAVRRPPLSIVAAFDIDPVKMNRILHGCRTYGMDKLAEVIRELEITVGVLTVPASVAQEVAESMLAAGVRSFLNFAPVPLRLPPRTFVEEMDIAASMEKAAYFARALAVERGGRHEHHHAG
jgi:redox-sensing transcriptional repressor